MAKKNRRKGNKDRRTQFPVAAQLPDVQPAGRTESEPAAVPMIELLALAPDLLEVAASTMLKVLDKVGPMVFSRLPDTFANAFDKGTGRLDPEGREMVLRAAPLWCYVAALVMEAQGYVSLRIDTLPPHPWPDLVIESTPEGKLKRSRGIDPVFWDMYIVPPRPA